ncbi:Nn.00g043900.m01.CDS01 [Neocucurbitaria sp. VM-36]
MEDNADMVEAESAQHQLPSQTSELDNFRNQWLREIASSTTREDGESIERIDSPDFDLEPQNPILPELFPDRLFGDLLIRPELASSGVTAVPCSVCLNFATYKSGINPDEAKHRADVGCMGCKLIVCAIQHFLQNKTLDWRKERSVLGLVSQQTQELKLRASITAYRPTISVRSKNGEEEYEVFTTAGVSAYSRGVKERRLTLRNSGAPESFDLISQWLNECRNHDDCGSTSAKFPSRVLDIGCSEGIKLRPGTGLTGRYCALSHCWGTSNPPARTTRVNLQSRQAKIDENTLSKTFRDAIALARHLSIRFMWIDSLCIIQDDKEDWEKESANMASVYRNAYLVITATRAEHGDIGCFSDRQEPMFCFDIPQGNGQKAPVYLRNEVEHLHFEPSAMYNAKQFRQYPLLARAWCLQERLLATRMVHFAGDELVWECRTRTRCECGELDEHAVRNSSFIRRWTIDRDPKKLFDLWHKTVSLYSSLCLTRGSDYLPALSGLAQHIQERGCGNYIYGIWEENIAADLMWVSALPRPRTHEWRAPSWSWACADFCQLRFFTQQSNSPALTIDLEKLRDLPYPSKTPAGEDFKSKIVSIEDELGGAVPAGKPHRKVMSLSAPVVEALLLVQKGFKWELKREEEVVRPNSLDHLDCLDDFAGPEVPLLCVWLGTIWETDGMRPQILLLQPSRGLGQREAAPGCYERVGAFTWETDVSILLKWFTHAEVECVKIV